MVNLKFKIIFLSVLLVMLFDINIFAQFEDFEDDISKKPEKTLKFNEKLVYGGDFGLQLGTQTYVNLSPQIGYLIYPQFCVGTGVNLLYYSIKTMTGNFSSLNYGANLFAQYVPISFLVVHAETQLLNVKLMDNTRAFDLANMVGIGYRQRLGVKGSVNYLVLWNFNQTETSLNTNPIIRINFFF